MPSDHHFLLNGEKWLWRYSHLTGTADGWTDYSQRKILIHSKLRGRAKIECEIHEGLHACLGPAVSESAITQAAKDLAKVLVSLGYRQQTLDK